MKTYPPIASLPKFFLFVGILICVTGVITFSQEPRQTAQVEKERIEAEKLWEQMVKVRGGREKLHAISNLMITKGNDPESIQIELFVFPYRYWEWTKEKKLRDLFFVEMENLDKGVIMAASHKGLITDQRGLSEIKKASYVEGHLMEACSFFLETKWLQPTPVRVRQQMVGKERLDVIETIFPKLVKYKNWRQDFYVDPESLVVRGVAKYALDGNMYDYRSFDGYTTINDLSVPLRMAASFIVTEPKKREYVSLSFQFNVDYDEKLFERPPSEEAGPDAWKRKL